MRLFACVFFILGFLGLVAALKMDTSVVVPGSSELGGPANRIYNLGLADDRRTVLTISLASLLAGVVSEGFAVVAKTLRRAGIPPLPASGRVALNAAASTVRTEKAEWFYRFLGQNCGPVSARELLDLARRGTLSRDTLVRKGIDGTPVPAEKVRGLFDSDDR